MAARKKARKSARKTTHESASKSAAAALREYERKRDFSRTAEPSTRARSRPLERNRFVVQKHAARALHYDFRLELDGVLKSWAVPKGPSLDPHVKRMAVATEDHPLAYADFEGVIPKGEYGGGKVELWDRGTWEPIGDPHVGFEKGHIGFHLFGEKLKGHWDLARLRPRPGDRGKTAWLLIKHRDAEARSGKAAEITEYDDAPLAQRAPKRKASARATALPRDVELQLATLVTEPPDGPEWVHELKLDGYRILARISAGKVELVTRNGVDRAHQMPALVEALSRLPVDSALIDGEVVALDENGISRFRKLQDALGGRRPDVRYFAFDLLFQDGEDLRDAPLGERKERLRALLAKSTRGGLLHYCDHLTSNGDRFLAEVCRSGAEGIISKRLDAPYSGGRGRSWLKIKCSKRQELVIVGFTPPTTAKRVGFGALLLGVYDDAGALHFCGKVGTGFSDAALADLYATLVKLERETPPVVDASSADRDARWVTPKLVAEVTFTEWTRDGKLRHPSFIALRSDKPASAIRIERETDTAVAIAKSGKKAAASKRPAPAKRGAPAKKSAASEGETPSTADERAAPPVLSEVAGVKLSSPDRILFSDLGVTKSELAQYCETMAERILPGLVNRPLSLVRCPDGCDKPCFYQKHATDSTPERVGRVAINKGETPYAMVKDLAGLVSLVQISTIELHVWGSRVDQIEKPDLIVLDLDPDPTVPWRRLADTAKLLRALLIELELVPFLRTTGGKGLHVVAPLIRRSSWDEVKAFTHAIALQLVREAPDQFTAQISKSKRRGKILIDYLRNQRDATAIASYSVRARPGAPVAVPIEWDALDAAEGPPVWNIRTAPDRLREPDPWKDFESSRRPLTAKAQRSVQNT